MPKKVTPNRLWWSTFFLFLVGTVVIVSCLFWYYVHLRKEAADAVGVLFVAEAQAGTMSAQNSTSYQLTLIAPDKHVIWFTDRPSRQSGTLTLATWLEGWNAYGFTPSNPPNAAIIIDPESNELRSHSFEVTLSNPMYDKTTDTLTMTISPLKSEDLANLPSSFKDVKLFIDATVLRGQVVTDSLLPPLANPSQYHVGDLPGEGPVK